MGAKPKRAKTTINTLKSAGVTEEEARKLLKEKKQKKQRK